MLESIRKTVLVKEKFINIYEEVLAELQKVFDMLKKGAKKDDKPHMWESCQQLFWKIFEEEKNTFPEDIRDSVSETLFKIVRYGREEWTLDPHQIQIKAVILLERIKISLKEELRDHPDLKQFIIGEMLRDEDLYKKKEIQAKKNFMKVKQSVCIIQRRFRAYINKKQAQKKTEAAVVIQACFRGYMVHREYRKERAAIVKIQSGIRKFLARRRYAGLKDTVIGIQRQFRRKLSVARIREKFLITKGAAITIQAHYRRHLQQKNYNQKKRAIIKLQTLLRMKMQRDLFLLQKMAVCKIQRWFKNIMQRDRAKTEYQMTRKSVIFLQSAVRGWIARKQAKQRKLSIIHIQAEIRKLIILQKFQILKKYTEICQWRYRAKLHGRLVHHQYLALREAALTMQSRYRGKQTRKLMFLKQESARIIQSWYKGRKQYILYTKLRQSVLLCQKTFRASRLTKTDRRKFLVIKGAALTIQVYYREYKTRCMYQEMKQTIVLLKSGSNGFMDRRRLRELQEAAAITQRVLKNHLHIKLVKHQEVERQTYLLQFTRKTTAIQRDYRKYESLCEAKKQLYGALIIQNWMKGRLCRLRFLKLKESVSVSETAALKREDISHDKEIQQGASTIQEEGKMEQNIEPENVKAKKLGRMKRCRRWIKRCFCC
ncbi:abnormal spindle-like microcephaly-associated protein homolog isoform X2 [Saccostrea echinata]|uniref:abnormal spindle-like microcephaly-associated protein homolog isoform X2 n=1 Tax=Saccostrea echinata TaxID=191078 RepID=UPI002A80E69A|nr:abnormal spindle-like microcephaly-associated protein homolog isoform X2 [Saccostrea echinata]